MHVSVSDIIALNNQHLFKKREDVIIKKYFGLVKKVTEQQKNRMKKGAELEDTILKYSIEDIQRTFKIKSISPQVEYRIDFNNEIEILGYADLVIETEFADIIIEAKNTSMNIIDPYSIPKYYIWQVLIYKYMHETITQRQVIPMLAIRTKKNISLYWLNSYLIYELSNKSNKNFFNIEKFIKTGLFFLNKVKIIEGCDEYFDYYLKLQKTNDEFEMDYIEYLLNKKDKEYGGIHALYISEKFKDYFIFRNFIINLQGERYTYRRLINKKYYERKD